MCGRYALTVSATALSEQFAVAPPSALVPRYNIAPTQAVVIIRSAPGARICSFVRWGLVPSWARDSKIGQRMINARAETVAEKPAFRAAFRRRRCLVPASGYYEWVRSGAGKQPYYIRPAEDDCFAFAGLYEHWEHDGHTLQTCTIITCPACAELASLHDRMPVIVERQDYARWLDAEDQREATSVLRSSRSSRVMSYPVGRQVNSPRHDAADCIQPLAQ